MDEIADHIVVRRVCKPCDRGHGLVIHAVDHHIDSLSRRNDLFPQRVVCYDHHHADHQKEDDGKAHVHSHEHSIVRIGERKQAHYQSDTHGLQE